VNAGRASTLLEVSSFFFFTFSGEKNYVRRRMAKGQTGQQQPRFGMRALAKLIADDLAANWLRQYSEPTDLCWLLYNVYLTTMNPYFHRHQNCVFP
jgi:hypothetical protein